MTSKHLDKDERKALHKEIEEAKVRRAARKILKQHGLYVRQDSKLGTGMERLNPCKHCVCATESLALVPERLDSATLRDICLGTKQYCIRNRCHYIAKEALQP